MTQNEGRSIVLTIWLVLLIGGGAVASVVLFTAYDEGTLGTSDWVLLTLGVLALAKAAAGVVLMLGKGWGFWLNLAATAVALAVSLVDGMKFYLAVLFLVDPTVLYLLMRPAWDHFE